jgi:ATP-dependent protease HslVU (ClpYQ) ATPase subunit
MGNTNSKTKKSRETLVTQSKETEKIISEENIRDRAFEIYQENGISSFSELDNWCYAERELNGYYK